MKSYIKATAWILNWSELLKQLNQYFQFLVIRPSAQDSLHHPLLSPLCVWQLLQYEALAPLLTESGPSEPEMNRVVAAGWCYASNSYHLAASTPPHHQFINKIILTWNVAMLDFQQLSRPSSGQLSIQFSCFLLFLSSYKPL